MKKSQKVLLLSLLLGLQNIWITSYANSDSDPLGRKSLSESLGKTSSARDQVAPEAEDFLSAPGFDLVVVREPTAVPALVKVGDRLKLKLTGIPPDLKMDFTQDEKLPSQWNISEELSASEQKELGKGEYVFYATPLKVGQLEIASLPLKDSSGKVLARTHPFSQEVSSAIAADDPRPEEAEGLEPPISLSFPTWVLVLGAVLGLGAVAVIIYALIRWRKRRKAARPESPAPVIPSDQLALERLLNLEKQGFLSQKLYKSHYFGVSEILKSYVGARFQFDASESTTDEMLSRLRSNTSVSRDLVAYLEDLYAKLDLVKFTDHLPSDEEAGQMIARARDFISQSKGGMSAV